MLGMHLKIPKDDIPGRLTGQWEKTKTPKNGDLCSGQLAVTGKLAAVPEPAGQLCSLACGPKLAPRGPSTARVSPVGPASHPEKAARSLCTCGILKYLCPCQEKFSNTLFIKQNDG